MSIGEDVPMLVPVSIVLTIFLLFIFFLFANSSENFDIVKMSQTSLSVGDYIIKITNSGINTLSKEKLDSLGGNCNYKCASLKEVNITSNYKLYVYVKDSNGNCWCWGKEKDSTKAVSNALPVLIKEKDKLILGKVTAVVSK